MRHHDGFDLAESLCAHSESLGKRMHAFPFTMEYSCHISREHFFETLGRSIPGQWNRIRVLCASVQEGAGMETGLSSSRNAKDSISLVYECARDCVFLMNVPARDHSHESRAQIHTTEVVFNQNLPGHSVSWVKSTRLHRLCNIEKFKC